MDIDPSQSSSSCSSFSSVTTIFILPSFFPSPYLYLSPPDSYDLSALFLRDLSYLSLISSISSLIPYIIKPNYPPPQPHHRSLFLLKILLLLASSSLDDLSALFLMTIILYPKPPFILLVLNKLTYHQGSDRITFFYHVLKHSICTSH